MTDWNQGSPVHINNQDEQTASDYVTVNVNTTGTTDLLDPSNTRRIHGVFGAAATASSTIDLELTDGTNTATLDGNADGDDVVFGETFNMRSTDKLQANVTSADTDTDTTLVVLHSAVDHVTDE
jgi:hypothetical protein